MLPIKTRLYVRKKSVSNKNNTLCRKKSPSHKSMTLCRKKEFFPIKTRLYAGRESATNKNKTLFRKKRGLPIKTILYVVLPQKKPNNCSRFFLLKILVKVFISPYLLNMKTGEVDTLYVCRYWSEAVSFTITAHLGDLEVMVPELEIL